MSLFRQKIRYKEGYSKGELPWKDGILIELKQVSTIDGQDGRIGSSLEHGAYILPKPETDEGFIHILWVPLNLLEVSIDGIYYRTPPPLTPINP